ncbi:hypothetical protein PHPALM_9052 [Phytophthora palmivora]|uniref:Uncharacterized protein n=1 Tax=Phytophthora palmivora TaxID=4796 RepID=A0A2P4Y8N8_9STRA|nr:hypothetical protein PHPALM_9052 [Phytophthora palmivora]
MPRLSTKQRELRQIRGILAKRETAATSRDLLSDADSEEDELDEYWILEYELVLNARYAGRSSNYRKRKGRWIKVLYNTEHTNDTEFICDITSGKPVNEHAC